jgi:hypothetical protein
VPEASAVSAVHAAVWARAAFALSNCGGADVGAACGQEVDLLCFLAKNANAAASTAATACAQSSVGGDDRGGEWNAAQAVAAAHRNALLSVLAASAPVGRRSEAVASVILAPCLAAATVLASTSDTATADAAAGAPAAATAAALAPATAAASVRADLLRSCRFALPPRWGAAWVPRDRRRSHQLATAAAARWRAFVAAKRAQVLRHGVPARSAGGAGRGEAVLASRGGLSNVNDGSSTSALPWLLELLVNPHDARLRQNAALLLLHCTSSTATGGSGSSVQSAGLLGRVSPVGLLVLDALFGLLGHGGSRGDSGADDGGSHGDEDAGASSDDEASGSSVGDGFGGAGPVWSVQLLAVARHLIDTTPHAAPFLVARGALRFLAATLVAAARRLRRAELRALASAFSAPEPPRAEATVLVAWLADTLVCLAASSAAARGALLRRHSADVLEALALLKDLLLHHDHWVADAVRLLTALSLAPLPSSVPTSAPSSAQLDGKGVYLAAAAEALDRVWTSSSDGAPVSAATAAALVAPMVHLLTPPTPAPNFRVFLRRAPTQEEFFQGSLARNPMHVSELAVADPMAADPMAADPMAADGQGGAAGGAAASGGTGRGSGDDSDDPAAGDRGPTVGDLRRRIAAELNMADASELLELLVRKPARRIHSFFLVFTQIFSSRAPP